MPEGARDGSLQMILRHHGAGSRASFVRHGCGACELRCMMRLGVAGDDERLVLKTVKARRGRRPPPREPRCGIRQDEHARCRASWRLLPAACLSSRALSSTVLCARV